MMKEMGFIVGKIFNVYFIMLKGDCRCISRGRLHGGRKIGEQGLVQGGDNGRMDVEHEGRVGDDENDHKHVGILNRIVEWKEDRIYYEADQRHAEI